MASPFAKYQSEQVQQIAPGFVEAYGKAGASIGQGLAAIGQAAVQGYEEAEKKGIEIAKQQGAINPYLRTEVKNVDDSLKNGFLVKGKDGKVSIAPGQEKNLDPNKVGRAIDLYNMTDGGTKKMKAEDLTAVISTIQSYDAMEKTAAEKAKAVRDAKISELDYTSKILGNAATLSDGLAAFAKTRTELGIAAGMQGDTQGASLAIAEGRALTDKAMQIRFSAMKDAGINVDAYMPPAPVAAPVRPAAAAVGSGASTLYTVPTDTDFKASLGRFDAMRTAGSTPISDGDLLAGITPEQQAKMDAATRASSTGAPVATAPTAVAPAPVDYGTRVDGTAKGAGFLGEIKLPNGQVATEVSVGVNINGKDVEIPTLVPTLSAEQKTFIAGGGDPRTRPDIIKAATEHASKRIASGMSPFNGAVAAAPAPAAPAAKPTARQLMTGQMPAVEPAAAPVVQGQTPAAGQQPTRAITPNAAIVQAEAEIKSLQTAKTIYIDQQKRFKTMASVSGLMPDQVKSFQKLAEDSFKMSLDIDDQITKKMTLISTEKSSVASGRTAETKLSLDVTKAIEDIAPSFGSGWGSKKYWHIIKNYPDDPTKGLSDIRVGGFQGNKSEVIDILGSRSSFMDATMSIENALDERLEKGGVSLFDLLTLDKGDYAAYTAGNVGEKILLASMRKAIVSGGNFSDADRGFVLEAIAAINNLDPRKREPYLKALNKTMAEMVIGLYDRKLAANGVERRLELLTEDERKEAVPPTEAAFMNRFGIDAKGKASGSRSELQSLIGEQRGTGKFGASRASAASALDKFVADAKAEAEAAKAQKSK
jgi:hypothetical protein